MLVTTRRRDQEFFLAMPDGTTVVIKVMGTGDARVRLAVAAPKDVQILRGELLPPEQRVEWRAAAGMKETTDPTE
jgi:sRNA-binding carbon storage regulator CsrA